MTEIGTNALPNTERTELLAIAENPWQTAAAASNRLGDTAAAIAFHRLAYDASATEARRYDEMNDKLDSVSSRVAHGVNRIHKEIANPRSIIINNMDYMKSNFSGSVNGTSLIGSLNRREAITHDERNVTKDGDLISITHCIDGWRMAPDANWETVFDRIVLMTTDGNPQWRDDQVPDLIGGQERAELEERVEETSGQSYGSGCLHDTDYFYKYVVPDGNLLRNLQTYDELRSQFDVRRTPTIYGVDLVHLKERNPTDLPHIQQFLIAQKLGEATEFKAVSQAPPVDNPEIIAPIDSTEPVTLFDY